MYSILDPLFAGCPGIEMYISWLVPDAYKHPRSQPRLSNWSEDDIDMFCGTRKEIDEF